MVLTRHRNYVFFRENSDDDVQHISPFQSGGNQILLSPQLKASLVFFRHVVLSEHAVYNSLLENADDALRVPEMAFTTQLAYSNIHFNGNFDVHTGVEMHWNSAYYAPAYDPATRQFYNQDKQQVNAFPLVDIFLDAKIKRARIFIKYNNLVQALTKSGYLITPGYPGQRNVIDFGFDWSFYD